MSMRNFGCHGLVVKASDLTKLLLVEDQPAYEQMLSNHDWEIAQAFLEENLPPQYPMPDSLFLMSDEWESEDLEYNVVYAYWDDESLYERVPRVGLLALQKKEVKPGEANWVAWA